MTSTQKRTLDFIKEFWNVYNKTFKNMSEKLTKEEKKYIDDVVESTKKTEAKVGNAIHALLQGVDGATEQLATGIQVAKEELKKKRTPEPPKTDLT